MDDLVFLGTALLLVVMLPVLIGRMMSRARRRRRNRAAFGTGFDAAFEIFDPAKARAQEIILIQQDIGQTDEGESGERIVRDGNDTPILQSFPPLKDQEKPTR